VPFKKGPDYIDAEWLSKAAKHPCFNLDPFLMDKETILASFVSRAQKGDIAIIEGNRGLFDGMDQEGSSSTAELAKLLKAPVILVVDCTKATRTIAALVLGCKAFDPELSIQGVILNRIGTQRHVKIVQSAIEKYTNIPVIGAIKRQKKDPLPMRHLGVTPTDEHPSVINTLDSLKDLINTSIDLDYVKKIAASAPSLPDKPLKGLIKLNKPKKCSSISPLIGIFRDAAFQFYYPENLEMLEKLGAKLVFINSLTQPHLPQVDALYIGGGFPETQAEKLANNHLLRQAVKAAIEAGLPVYAECGGLMYLGQHIIWNGKKYPMVGAINWDFMVGKKPVGHGYTILEVTKPNPFYAQGTILRGHEFHYSKPVPANPSLPTSFACKVQRGAGFIQNKEGIIYKNLFATYTHIHVLSSIQWAQSLVDAACSFQEKNHML